MKMTGYGAVLLASLAVAMALLLSSPVEEAEASAQTVALTNPTFTTVLPGPPTQTPANSTVGLSIGGGAGPLPTPDTGTAAGDVGTGVLVVTIDAASSGAAQFTANGSTAIVCIDGDPSGCDRLPGTGLADTTGDGLINILITNTGVVGTVLLHLQLLDGVDGLDGLAPASDVDKDVLDIAYTTVTPTGEIRLFAGIASTGGAAASIPATPATSADQIVLAAQLRTASGAPAVVTAGQTINFTANNSASGIFADSITETAANVMPDSYGAAQTTASGLGFTAGLGPAVGAALTFGQSGCIGPAVPGLGEGQQQCNGSTVLADDGEGLAAEPVGSATAVVMFEGAGVPGTANLQASFGTLKSNIIPITLFGPPAAVEVSISTNGGVGTCIAAIACSNRISNLASASAGAAVPVTSVDILTTDALGFPVSGHVPQIRVNTTTPSGERVTFGAVPLSGSNGISTVAVMVPGAAGTSVPEVPQTLEVSLAGGTFVVGDALDVDLVGPIDLFTFVSQSPEGTVPALEQFSVVFRCTTPGGLDCLPGPVPFVGITGAGLLAPGPAGAIGAQGLITVNVIAEDQQGNSIAIVVANASGSIQASHVVTITPEVGGDINMGGGGAGVFSPVVAPQGQTFTTFSGGSLQSLLSALQAAGATSATATLPDGSTVTAIVTTLSFVNADFSAAFPTIPPGTIFAVRSLN